MIASLSINSGGGGGGGGGGGSSSSSSNGGPGSRVGRGLGLHRSNSSLELPHSPDPTSRVPDTPLRREYGSHGKRWILLNIASVPLALKSLSLSLSNPFSHNISLPLIFSSLHNSGSIDVVAQSVPVGENFFAMLQDFRSPDQRSSNSNVELLRRLQDSQSPDTDEVCGPTGSSPKLRLKLNRFWSSGGKPPRTSIQDQDQCQTPGTPIVSADVEERHRRRAFAHYDCQSLTANLGYAAKLRGILLARRRNTATGASAASSLRASTPDEVPEDDIGDGKGT